MDDQSPTPEEELATGDQPDALTPKQERALQALLIHSSRKEAAAAAGISDATLWRYQKDPAFVRRLQEARSEAFDHTVARLQQGAPEVVSVLFDLVRREDVAPGSRVAAIRLYLEYYIRGTELQALRAELEELKEYLRKKEEEEELSEQYYEA